MMRNNRPNRLILLELNELNFDLVRRYISKFPGRFPGFEKLIAFQR